MRRAIFTLVALGALLPLAAETAEAGGRDRKRHERKHDRDHKRDRDRKHERKRFDVHAGPGGISIGYHHVKRTGPRGRHHRHYRGPRHGRVVRVGVHIGPRPGYRWVPGHYVYEKRHRRLPDRFERVWVPDRYEWRRDCYGRRYRVLVEGGHWVERVIPGRVVTERVRVWVDGHWERC